MLFSIFHCLVGPAPGTVYYMGTTMTDVGTITVRLDEGDEELLDELAKRHGSRSDAIRAAIRELSARAELARKEGRPADASEIEQRIAGYREELAQRP